jgi:hypothetical protein
MLKSARARWRGLPRGVRWAASIIAAATISFTFQRLLAWALPDIPTALAGFAITALWFLGLFPVQALLLVALGAIGPNLWNFVVVSASSFWAAVKNRMWPPKELRRRYPEQEKQALYAALREASAVVNEQVPPLHAEVRQLIDELIQRAGTADAQPALARLRQICVELGEIRDRVGRRFVRGQDFADEIWDTIEGCNDALNHVIWKADECISALEGVHEPPTPGLRQLLSGALGGLQNAENNRLGDWARRSAARINSKRAALDRQ